MHFMITNIILLVWSVMKRKINPDPKTEDKDDLDPIDWNEED